jgi:tol-pal system protein YbgF
MRGVTRAAVLSLIGLVAVPAHAQSKGERLDSLEARMDGVERQLANQGLLDMSRQIDALTEQLRQLRGDIDELQHSLDQARAQQRDQYVDLDTRLRAAEAALTAAQATVAGGSPEAEYQAAFNLLKDGKYDEASSALQAFVGKYPQHELAPNAMYWLGEAHYVRRDYPAALAAFEGLLKDYPGNRKTPDALLKVGYCEAELKRPGPARAALARVIQEFPDSQAAAEAKARLDRMGNAGG